MSDSPNNNSNANKIGILTKSVRFMKRGVRKLRIFFRHNKVACIASLSVIGIFTVAMIVAACVMNNKMTAGGENARMNVSGSEDGVNNSNGEEGKNNGGLLGGLFKNKTSQGTVSDSSEGSAEGSAESSAEGTAPDPTLLQYKADAKNGYMNNCIFLGDSRTVAMVNYGFVSDEAAFAQIGISHTAVEKATITNNAGRDYTLDSYLQSHDAQVVFVCYGVNGMNGLSEEKYESSYNNLVDHIIAKAPKSKIVLMSIWPVDDYGRYKNSVQNSWIDKYNDFLYKMAEEKGLHYLNVSEILKGKNGQIKPEYDAGDGLHYKACAYTDILDYIIHHPVPGVSDSGEFVVKYVKPSKENSKIMTEQVKLPDNVQVVDPATLVQEECKHDPYNTSDKTCPKCGNPNPYYQECKHDPNDTTSQKCQKCGKDNPYYQEPKVCKHDPNDTTSKNCKKCGKKNPYYIEPEEPIVIPTVTPTPTPEPEIKPTPEVTPEPTPEITPEPTPEPTSGPTPDPTPEPSSDPPSEPSEPSDDTSTDIDSE